MYNNASCSEFVSINETNIPCLDVFYFSYMFLVCSMVWLTVFKAMMLCICFSVNHSEACLEPVNHLIWSYCENRMKLSAITQSAFTWSKLTIEKH